MDVGNPPLDGRRSRRFRRRPRLTGEQRQIIGAAGERTRPLARLQGFQHLFRQRNDLPSLGKILEARSTGDFDGGAYGRDYPERMNKTIYLAAGYWSWKRRSR